ncbi:MAG: hypothetical protein IJJ01_11755 [Firmicutes bacterium]|nr:hypothetical protein [Clostridia bacterium]MBR0457329.1 hypothetical protein [Bacillota bacterium]
MGNKLRSVFNKNEQYIKGTIGFKDAEAALEFREALKTVYKEGRTVPVNGVESMTVSIDSGAGSFQIEKNENLEHVVIGLTPDEVMLKLEVNGERIDFPVDRYSYENGYRVQTKGGFPFSTTLMFDETTQTAEVNIKPILNKAADVDTVLRSIRIENAFLNKFFRTDLKEGTGLDAAKEHLDSLYKLFEKLKFVEDTFDKKFVPGEIDLDNIECIKDLIELTLLIRDKKVLRADVRMTDTIGNRLQVMTDEEAVVGKEIAITFIGGLEYSLWNEKIDLHCASLLNNAIVKAIENLESGQIRIVYGEEEDRPMYIVYRGFVNQDEAKAECDRMLDIMEEYENARTVEEYIGEGY